MQDFSPSADSCPRCHQSDLFERSVSASDVPRDKAAMRIKGCRRCDFAWQWPLIRSKEDSKEFFLNAFVSGHEGTNYFDQDYKTAICEVEFSYFKSFFDSPQKLLDIGAGSGAFVKIAAKAGWVAIGVDPAAPADLEESYDEGRCRLIRGTTDDIHPDELFDAITMWDVIEHVERPLDLLRDAWSRLNPGGRIFVETGNFQSLERIQAGPTWWAFQHDHRWYHAPQEMMDLLDAAGFSNIALCDRVLRPNWTRPKSNFTGPSLRQHIEKAVASPLSTGRIFTEYLEQKRAAKSWSNWLDKSIFTMTGVK